MVTEIRIYHPNAGISAATKASTRGAQPNGVISKKAKQG
ncbi:hypothetical protein L917_02564 [Phytophthora nicotianae]|uniref:Uncharacterized protein n=1 Tax=Phytophthora nicotianae TaxID=4792 RepID=W2LVU0_PHYNI|nr:hypothetical protein L916_02625 [Phytophthora nicotianae]ETM00736.1 hypothetical protein L917_02564 [Phytophthora nicotianae]